jgi:calmodulin
LRQDELTKLFQRVDPQQEGAVKFDKFCDCMMQPMKNPETENEILEAFRAFDYQGGGTIAAAEFQTVMRNYGEALSDDEVDEILKVAQQQCEVQPGIIDYRRLTKMMCQ